MGSFVDVFNTSHTRGAVSILDNKSYFNVYWPVQMNVYWQDETPVEGAAVDIYTLVGGKVFAGVTDGRGSPAPTLWMKEYTAHNMVVTSYSPYRITASKGRASSLDSRCT